MSIATTPSLRRRRGMTEQAATAAIDQACRRLRLPTIRAVVEEASTVAQKEQLTYAGFLAELLLTGAPRLSVISYNEVSRTAQIESLGVVSGAVAIR